MNKHSILHQFKLRTANSRCNHLSILVSEGKRSTSPNCIIRTMYANSKTQLSALPQTRSNKFLVTHWNAKLLINTIDIVFAEAQGNYCVIHLKNGKKIILSKTLKKLLDIIPVNLFLRCHQSYVINRECIEKINAQTEIELYINGKLLLIPIARRRKSEIFRALQQSI